MSLLLAAIAPVVNEIRRQVALYQLGRTINKMAEILYGSDDYDMRFIQVSQRAIHRLETAKNITPKLVTEVNDDLYSHFLTYRWLLTPQI